MTSRDCERPRLPRDHVCPKFFPQPTTSNTKSLISKLSSALFHVVTRCTVSPQIRENDPEWNPSAMIMDASDAEISATQLAFGFSMPIFICHWHWQRSVKKQLFLKVKLPFKIITAATHTCTFYERKIAAQVNNKNVEPMFRDLLALMRTRAPQGHRRGAVEADKYARNIAERFCEKWEPEEAAFVAYFKKQWLPKIGMRLSSPFDTRSCRTVQSSGNG